MDRPSLPFEARGGGDPVLLVPGTGFGAGTRGDFGERLEARRGVIAYGRRGFTVAAPQPAGSNFRKNVPRHLMATLREYVRWLHRGEGRAERLCQAGLPTWIVHAEKGDGDLTATSAGRSRPARTRTW